MAYRKINIELVVFADECEAVVGELNSAIDWIEEKHAIFGGGIETIAVEDSGTRRKSALRHTLDARDAAASAIKLAAHKVAGAYRKVI